MTIETPRDLFEHHLKAAYYVENELVENLAVMADEVTEEELFEDFQEHEEETQQHVQRLETVFESIGEEPTMEESAALDGLVEEKNELSSEIQDDELRNVALVGAGIKTERVEISMYEGLIQLADQMDVGDDVTDALEANMSDEKDALQKLKSRAEGSKLKEALAELTG
jgi:ferritin-like metal-binding protein YciE